MAEEITTQALLPIPSAVAGVSITPSNQNWGNSSWVQLTASTSSAIILAGISWVGAQNATIEIEFEIGKGAAGSETVVGTLRVTNFSLTTKGFVALFPILINNIVSGQRVAVRMRKNNTNTAAYKFTLIYYATGALTGVTTTANASQIVPAAANGVSVTPNATAWANSSYTELITQTSSAIILAGVTADMGASGVEFEIDIATGSAGSEVVITTLRGYNPGSTGPQWFFPFETPLDNIPSGTRVAVRLRKQGSDVTPWTFAITYYTKPL